MSVRTLPRPGAEQRERENRPGDLGSDKTPIKVTAAKVLPEVGGAVLCCA